MKKVLFLLLVILFSSNPNYVQAQSKTTKLLFIRHAEKINFSDMDPGLTEAGIERANHWAEFFKKIGIDAVYSTKTKRTLKTAEPIAKSANLEVIVYNAKTIDINLLAKVNKGKTVVIVGHSNTIPKMVNQLLKEDKYKLIEDDNYGNLYVVTIENGKATAGLMHIK